MDVSVDASNDNGYERESNGAITRGANWQYIRSHVAAGDRYWGGLRWDSGDFPSQGDTIDVCYIELYPRDAGQLDMNADVHFEELAAPLEISADAFDISSRDRSETSVAWVATATHQVWERSPELKTALQEVIDAHSPTAIFAILKPKSDATKLFNAGTFDYGQPAKLHIEFTPAGFAHSQAIVIG